MTTTKKQQGRRLGPFQLGRRCKHAAAELGHIHEARNVETGTSALVMMPGPRRSPKKNWQVRVSFQTHPPFFALEMEQAPASGTLAELAHLLTLLLSGLDAVGSNARTRAHLTREPMGRWLGRPSLKALAAAGLAVLALGGGLWLGMGNRPMGHPTPPPSTPEMEEFTAGGTSDPFSSGFLTDTTDGGEPVLARPLPSEPFKGQKRPPCKRYSEVELIGACWMPHELKAPCPDELYEYQGKCYVPAFSAKQPVPQSLER
ncbi:hypothetical protein JRI60_00955 [Archangium violaceum]|uniref:hypothetical protein n=1 Tax=Archangium violaceum TaxID=83451 RepID=UPI00194DD0A5|nr:hypothetical protein [Archangium violaceum]QRN97690.1 hypothetical protein JRI60_00955 [Archangium violaceum]